MRTAMILCYKRVDELKQVVNSLLQLDLDKYYFHIHSASNEADQVLVDNVLGYIETLPYNKEVVYVEQPLGCRKAFFSALSYIAEREDKFYFIEDDIVLNPDSALTLNSEIDSLQGVLKFGPSAEKLGIFWGWALDKDTANSILNTNLYEIGYESCKAVFEDEIHYRGFIELHNRGKVQPWDDEVGQILKLNSISVKVLPNCVTNIGMVSSREGGIPDGDIDGDNYVIFVNGKLVN